MRRKFDELRTEITDDPERAERLARESAQVQQTYHEFCPDWTVQPGATLLEALAERGINHAEFAALTDLGMPVLDRLFTGQEAITPEIAATLHTHLGIPARFWLNGERLFRTQLWKMWVACEAGKQ